MNKELTDAYLKEEVAQIRGQAIDPTHFITWKGCKYMWWVNEKTGRCGLHSCKEDKEKWVRADNPLR